MKTRTAVHAPVRFGTLSSTLYTSTAYEHGTTYVRCASTRPYAVYQEVGTGIYGPMRRRITPKRAKVLSWIESTPGQAGGPGGRRVFASSVKGSKPQRYFYRGLVDVFGRSRVTRHTPRSRGV